MIGLDLGATADMTDQGQRIFRARDPVHRGFQEFLGQVGIGLMGRFAIAVKDPAGGLGKEVPRRLLHIRPARRDRLTGAVGDERASSQGGQHLALGAGGGAGESFVDNADKFLGLRIGRGSVLFEELVAADHGDRQLVDLGIGTGQEVDDSPVMAGAGVVFPVGAHGLVAIRRDELDMELNRLFVPLQGERLAIHHHFQAGGHRADAVQPGRRQRFEDATQESIGCRTEIRLPVFLQVELFLQGDGSLGEEAEAAVLLAQGHHAVLQDGGHRRLDLVAAGWRTHGRLQERGDVLSGGRQVLQDLEHRDRLGDLQRQGLVGEPVGNAFDPIDDVAVTALDVPAQRIVEGDGVGQGAQGVVG